MKTFYTYFFTVLYVLAMYRPVAPLMEYIIEKDYIAEFLCINQDRPELACDGKCYLMQMLQEQQQERHHGFPKINLEDYPIGFVEFLDLPEDSANSESEMRLSDYINNYHYLYASIGFHPPSMLS